METIDYAKLDNEIKRYTGTVVEEKATFLKVELSELNEKGKPQYRTLTKTKILCRKPV